MLLHVPASLDGLLSLFRPCFTQPTFQTFRAMVVGQISRTHLRTICGMLVGSRLSGVWHHTRAHRFFSCARWSVQELGLRVADLIVERLLEPGAPLIVPVDDTLAKRRGRKVFGAGWHHDATANSAVYRKINKLLFAGCSFCHWHSGENIGRRPRHSSWKKSRKHRWRAK